jgi:phosphoribosyl 1,2-cyclic phosphate phosphodiesterase
LRVTFLGTGTSTGVPVPACPCRVCRSGDPRNRRLRQSVWLERGAASLLLDASTDFREQALRHRIERIDAILFTHHHADHIFGLDDTRVYAYRQRGALPAYGTAETLAGIRKTFWYAFADIPEGGGRPKIDLMPVEGPFDLLGMKVIPLPGDHGSMGVTGYRVGDFAYLTDCKRVPASTLPLLAGAHTLVLNALRHSPEHPTHMTVGEALAVVEAVRPSQTYFIHLGHELDYTELAAALPEGVAPAYDGMVLEIPDKP